MLNEEPILVISEVAATDSPARDRRTVVLSSELLFDTTILSHTLRCTLNAPTRLEVCAIWS